MKYNTRKYNSYDEYVSFQKEKTSNPEKIKKWMTQEWEEKIDVFDKTFSTQEYLKNCNKALCLGSRTGQEVVSLRKLGISDSIGIDLEDLQQINI